MISMPDRDVLITEFLAQTKWRDWDRSSIAGDASARSYHRLKQADDAVILMDAPPDNGEDTTPFAGMATFLTRHGLAPPQILAHDHANGFMVLTDLGQSDFAKWLTTHPADQPALYTAALDVLVHLQGVTAPPDLKRMTPQVGADMVCIVCKHYAQVPADALQREMQRALETHAPIADTLALRDFHAENLIWRPHHHGHDRVGLLDFQDAFIAPAGYDLASLLRDARRDVAPALADELIRYFMGQTGAADGFRSQLACLGVQRNLRILGVFARLSKQMGKPRYLSFMPRVWDHILRDLADPALADLKQCVLDTLPPPTPELLEGLQP